MTLPTESQHPSPQWVEGVEADTEIVLALTLLNTPEADCAVREEAGRILLRVARAMACQLLTKLENLGLRGLESEDLVQDLAEKACRRRAPWEGTSAPSARAWCYQVMYHHGLDHLRRYALRHRLSLLPVGPTSVEARLDQQAAQGSATDAEGRLQARLIGFALERAMQTDTAASRHLTTLLMSELDPRSLEEQAINASGLGPDASQEDQRRARNVLERHRSNGRKAAKALLEQLQ